GDGASPEPERIRRACGLVRSLRGDVWIPRTAAPNFTHTEELSMPHPRLALLACLALLPGLSSAQTEWIDVPLSAETWWEQGNAEFRQGEYAIDVPAGSALEYKLGLQEGAMITYSWTVEIDDPSLLGVEFHGHTEPVADEPGTVMFYKVHPEGRE